MSATHPTPMSSTQSTTREDSTGGAHVAWMFELTVREGRDADLQALMTEMVASTRRDEPGTLDYEWHLTDDGRQLHIFERYADAAAVMTHLATFGARYMGRFFDVLAPQRMTIYGPADDAVRAALAQLRPAVLRRAEGFSR